MSAIDLTALWVPLLRRLSDLSPRWGIWKNADRALAGSGDVDTAAPREDWKACTDAFASHMLDAGYGPVVVCAHPPETLFLLAMDPQRRTFHELDVLGRKYFRGGTMFRATDLLPLYETDARGFRRVRDGAEGLILLLQNGARWGGRRRDDGFARRPIVELLSKDPDGARDAGRAFRYPASAVEAAVGAVVAGGWDAGAMRAIEATAVGRALTEPAIVARRLVFRAVTKRSCAVVNAIFARDRVVDDPSAFLARVRATHQVIG